MMEPLTRQLVDFLARLGPENIGAAVLDRVRWLLLDYLGVASRGSQEPSSQAVYRMVERAGVSGPCTIFGTALKTSAEYAALANGAAAHSIELDDTHQAGSIHLGVVMFSTAIALSEQVPGITPEQFFTAVIAGYEASARIAMAVRPKDHYEMGFHPTATCGVFGAAVTAAKLLGLNGEKMLSAVGIAGSMAAGLLEFLADGSWTKRLHPGLAAKNGIQAAALAAEDFRGPSTVLEGRNGFVLAYSRKPDFDAIAGNLGDDFQIMQTGVKPHACCRYMQPGIDAILALAKQHHIHPDHVVRIEIAVLEAGWSLVCEPRGRKYRPQTVVDAQFSMPFGAAVALLYGDAGLDRFTEENLDSPAIKNLMARMVLEKDIRIEKNFPREWRGRVTMHLVDGRQYEHCVQHPKGDPQNFLSRDELLAKFRALGGTIPKIPVLLDSLQHIEV